MPRARRMTADGMSGPLWAARPTATGAGSTSTRAGGAWGSAIAVVALAVFNLTATSSQVGSTPTGRLLGATGQSSDGVLDRLDLCPRLWRPALLTDVRA